MRVSEGEATPKVHAYILTGNGSRDIRVVKATAEKYDHSKVLKVPQTPLKGTGLASVAKAVATLMSKRVGVSRYLIVIDREHVKSFKEVMKKFTEYGLEVKSTEELAEWSWVLKVRRGSREADVYVAVLGVRRRIEENLAKLIELTCGEKVEGSKKAVGKWLRKNKLEDTDLVRKASKQQVEEALPTLTKALKELASDT